MRVKIIDVDPKPEMEPLTCNRKLHHIPVAGETIAERLISLFEAGNEDCTLTIRADFWPSNQLIAKLFEAENGVIIRDHEQQTVATLSFDCAPDSKTEIITLDKHFQLLRYPWQILELNEQLTGNIKESKIQGKVRENVAIDGIVWLGQGTIILPGVFIEGNVIIGENCKIGPNCYLRGNTSIGDNCHIGQAVEIKNSLLMDHVSVGHLSYLGDSIICPGVNLGAGTISANLRHDGHNHRSQIGNFLVDTGRRKFGVVLGDQVHTGINTSLYPGRKMWPGTSTRPGESVDSDKRHPDTNSGCC